MNATIRMSYKIKGMRGGDKYPQFIMSNLGTANSPLWHMSNGANFTSEEINEHYTCLKYSRIGNF